MEILLIRHGKAEPPLRTDFERKLTESGRIRTLEASLGLKQLLGQRAYVIWTSPLPRARQTADCIAGVLGVNEVNEQEAIYSGDLESLIPAIHSLPEDSTLLLVGHEPCLSAWSERISGVSIAFRPGAVACFKITHCPQLLGKLHWFALAKVLARWGPGLPLAVPEEGK